MNGRSQKLSPVYCPVKLAFCVKSLIGYGTSTKFVGRGLAAVPQPQLIEFSRLPVRSSRE